MVADHFGNSIDIDIGAAQQFFCFIDTELVDIVGQGNASRFFKGSA